MFAQFLDGSRAQLNGPTVFGRGTPAALSDAFLSRRHMRLEPVQGQPHDVMLTNEGQNAVIVQEQQQDGVWKTAGIVQHGQQQQVHTGSRIFLPSREATTMITLIRNSSASGGGGIGNAGGSDAAHMTPAVTPMEAAPQAVGGGQQGGGADEGSPVKRRRISSPREQQQPHQQQQPQDQQLRELRQPQKRAWQQQQQQQDVDPEVQALLQQEGGGLTAQQLLLQQQEALGMYSNKQQQQQQQQGQHADDDIGGMLHCMMFPQVLGRGVHQSDSQPAAAVAGCELVMQNELGLLQFLQQQLQGGGADESMLPSQVKNNYWIHCRPKARHPDKTVNSHPEGKWMLFYNRGTILDGAWVKARRLFHAGELKGVHSMKVSTAMSNPNASDSKTGVLILYCGSESDEPGTCEIGRTILEKMEYKGANGTSNNPWISWKSDRQTAEGAYTNRGSKKNSMFRVSLTPPGPSAAAAGAPAAAPAAGAADREAVSAARVAAAAAALTTGDHVMCDCDLAAVLRVSSTKKNPGRRFYVCPKPRDEHTRCGYFVWWDEAETLRVQRRRQQRQQQEREQEQQQGDSRIATSGM